MTPQPEESQVELAERIARKAHEGQFRWDKVTPYITHPEAVASAVEGEDAKAVAWLHDVLEDTELSVHDLDALGMDYKICQAVLCITKVFGESYLNYLLRIKENPLVKRVKLADIRHNMITLDRVKNKNQFTKYEMALYILGGQGEQETEA